MLLGFGEIMMRVAPPGFLRFRQALPGRVDVTFAGGEANVCAAYSFLGGKARYVTALPRNAIAESLVAALDASRIDTRHILFRDKGRLGIYFLETGANQRGSVVIYDRDGSAVALASPDEYDFNKALEGVGWVHVTGITPALSENAFSATLALVKLARSRSIPVSCDLNFRKKLWRWKEGKSPNELARECMSEVLPHVDVVIGNEEDASDVLGIRAEGTQVEAGKINARAYEAVAQTIVKRFPNVREVAITLRESISASHNNWGGMLYDAKAGRGFFAPLDEKGEYRPYEIRDIVDRVGGGDSFAGALIFALRSKDYSEPSAAIRFASAASCLKHSVKGDWSFIGKDEVLALMRGESSGRVRR
ncbi:MAG: sugar kinase [Planctomycetota bacterium]